MDADLDARLLRILTWSAGVGLAIFLIGVRLSLGTDVSDWKYLVDAKICTAKVPPDAVCAEPSAVSLPKKDLPAELQGWLDERSRIALECNQSWWAQCRLQQEVASAVDVAAFQQARKRLDEERARYAILVAQGNRLQFSDKDASTFLVQGLVDVTLTVFSLALLMRTGRPILARCGKKILRGWWSTVAAFIAVGILAELATSYFAGIRPAEKLWVSVDSYVVSKAAWSYDVLAVAGVVVMFAQPMTLLWQLGSRELVPRPSEIDPRASTGDCGVGGYVTFLQAWTILGFALALPSGILWVKHASAEQASFQWGYAIPVVVGWSMIAAIVARLVLSAIKLRENYTTALGDLGASWKEVQDLKPAPDPTIPFLGENWWKLPATLGSMLLAFWTVLEWTGVAGVLVRALRG